MKRTTFICIAYFLFSTGYLQAQSIYFDNYQTSDGLSNNTVTCIAQDQQGFLWFGSRNGLNRFDGHRFKIFKHNVADSLGIGSSSILQLLTDSKGRMWVGTTRGAYLYDPVKENFKRINQIPLGEVNFIKESGGFIWLVSNGKLYKYGLGNSKVLPMKFDRGNIISVTTDEKAQLWITSDRSSIQRYDTTREIFIDIDLHHTQKKLLDGIRTVYGINDSLLIIGTTSTAYLLNVTRGKLTDLFSKSYPKRTIHINAITQHSKSVFWLGTETGIYTYDLQTASINHIKKDVLNPFSISDNVILSFYKDREGSTWIGTFFGGLNQYTNQSDNFKKYASNFGKSALSGNIVHEICKDKYGNLWVGTEDGGLNKIDHKSGAVQHFVADGKVGSIAYNNIHGLVAAGDELWLGSTTHGLDILDITTGKVKRHYDTIGQGSLQSTFIVCLYKTRANTMLVGTSRGLFKYDRKNDCFKLLPLKSAWVQGIHEDADGVLWVNTYGSGVYIYDPSRRTVRHLYSKNRKSRTLINNYVNGLFEDSKNNIWLCTEGGLSKYRRDGSFTNYLTETGLPSNQIFKVLEDNDHNIWISTSKGLVRLEKTNPKGTIFKTRDGLPTEQFNYNSAYKDADGTLYFGTIKGMVSFNPEKSIKNHFIPPVFISNIQFNNADVTVREDGILKRSISLSNQLILTYDNSNINLNIAALSYVSPERNTYRYIMEGYDKGWTEVMGNQKIYYNKLPPGTYTFKFSGTNNNGVWNNKEKELRIIVQPPWWFSTWAYTFYALTFGTIILLVLRYYLILLKARNTRKMEIYERKKEQEVYNLKLEFFTNLAHEIKTPLTLIKMPLENIISRQKFLDKETVKDLALMEKNTSRIIYLTNQLLDFRKAETNNMSLIFTETDINALLSEVFNNLNYLAKDKQLQYNLSLPRITLMALVDEEALRKILTNLTHNAVKYAKKEVSVKLLPFNSDDNMFNIEFKNDGEIIPAEKKEKIFQPFYRLNDVDKDTGTGIGLSLSRSLVELHKGSLTLIQAEEDRNLFLLSIPIIQDQALDIRPFQDESPEDGNQNFNDWKDDKATEKPVILLVEDNHDILAYLYKELKADFSVLSAAHGAEALDVLDSNDVHLVITDIMMPVLDGIALCKRIKTDILYSHIPVIFLTAKNALNAKIQGLETGADAYIEKPFSIKHLIVQMRNILHNRKIIKNYFLNAPASNLTEIKVSSPDKDFIGHLNRIIYNNISDVELNVDELAKLMNMSRPTLYRKIKGLSDLTPNELINISRLKKGAELLSQKMYNITQVAAIVGYSVQSNFSRDFHKHYGMSPSVYIAKNAKEA